jgi:hypothetical protein
MRGCFWRSEAGERLPDRLPPEAMERADVNGSGLIDMGKRSSWKAWKAAGLLERDGRWAKCTIWFAGADRGRCCSCTAESQTPAVASVSAHSRANRVRHHGAAGAERLFLADRGIARGLVLDLRVELGADQHYDGRKPHPHHQADHCAECVTM